MKTTIKFYSNFKNGKVFVSGKNEQEKWFSLWKNADINEDLYLDNSKFKDGIEIEKSKLKLKDNDKDCKILVFKNEADEKEFCITKEEIDKRKQKSAKFNKKIVDNVQAYVNDIIVELFKNNSNLVAGELIEKIISENNIPESAEETEDNGVLPF